MVDSCSSLIGWIWIRNSRGAKVTVSGGFPLDLAWQQQGDILTGQFTGDCGEAYLGDYR